MEGSAEKQCICENDGIAGSASFTHTATKGQGMGNSSGYEYEVFLSFRGKDTRTGFTNFLYTSLIDVGIRVYKDDEELGKGEKFGPKLLQAINQSKISIPIFSKGYAFSIWCLKELVQMVECQKTTGQKIMPIFYDVAPSEVRHQVGGYREAFLSHESKKRYDEETIREWKAALTTVGELDGWDLPSMANRGEGVIAKTITQKVFNELKKAYLVVSNHLVSVDHHVEKIMEEIGARTSETRIVGIHGMGGIGKTTIAKIIYNELSNKYKNCCFLSNIRETSKLKGIDNLQHQLISDILKTKWMDIRNIDEGIKTIKDKLSNKRVLVLLDDVEEKGHMDALIGKRDWFGEGSKLIITTRRKDVLHVPEVDWSFELTGMDPDKSLQLFSKHAFRRDSPLDNYIDQSKRAIQIAGGLPLALEIIGSLLSNKNKEMWDATLKKLESIPPDEVQSKLKISYEALDKRRQYIFLEIACHFIGYHKDIVINYWDAFERFSEEALEVLENMSLIKIGKHNELWMHDQFRDLGREIVRQESEMKIEKQRWVWNSNEGLVLLRRHEEKEEVEALHLKFDDQHCFIYKDFKSLPNLKFLEVDNLKGNFHAKKMVLQHKWPSNVFQKNLDLLPQLRWLSLHNIWPKFKIANFSMENLIILDLSQSEITHDWKGWSHMKVIKNLKVLDLAYCRHLKRTPNFSAHSNLERLILSSCESLIEIDKSICQLKCLVFLDLSHCVNLERLPDELAGDFGSLEYLSLRRCRSLESLPEIIGNLESLTELDLSSTSIKELPNSIRKLRNLKVVKMNKSHIRKIGSVFWTLKKLQEINITGRYELSEPFHVEIGDCIYVNKSLRILRLEEVRIHALPRLPESLIELKLGVLTVYTFPDLSNLANLKGLRIKFAGQSNGLLEEPIPRWIGNLRKLESLYLHFFGGAASPTYLSLPPQPRHLPRLPSSLSSLTVHGCNSLCSMDLSNLRKLSSLRIWDSAVAEIQGLGCLENLRDLDIYWLRQLAMLPDLSKLNKLRSIQIRVCGNLVEIQGELPRFLDELRISSCPSLQELPDLFHLMGKAVVKIEECNQVLERANMDRRELWLSGFKQMQILPDLSNSKELTILIVQNCGNLVEIQGKLPQSLKKLQIESCESLQKLPDLSSLKKLRKVIIRRCGKLDVEEISRLCSENSVKFCGKR
ncbi:hypothetical protein BT93_L0030 [Corymbia citriodora subsp. variegata]|uniref:TIR domain-containing protein n=1 Tax=Corymbia citriodora subsp. variegata TaxID=360336 RepID=A0A8T0CQS5_CORYI|nr:hypothetical protein BT93_L0030 [Corymbia citriodora subsp. variegata]KAF7850005.1 hypothetical protein BT93_L0030 [Corymbia citriodora subsp. variegata]KAF7850006.1 hypothetical protein BT93_L0030 [Corymbia citriodora subsp. variegata]KAF7850007.1 hypothetical protein BT93_L0030 [Corymbia citriodora subsp. variegata]